MFSLSLFSRPGTLSPRLHFQIKEGKTIMTNNHGSDHDALEAAIWHQNNRIDALENAGPYATQAQVDALSADSHQHATPPPQYSRRGRRVVSSEHAGKHLGHGRA